MFANKNNNKKAKHYDEQKMAKKTNKDLPKKNPTQ
jgi:hypothetical protein